jgi:hypothetical protein
VKTFSLTVTQHGGRAISVAVVSDDENGGSAVPAFGKDALRLALMYLEELSTATITGELEHVQMMNEGRTFDELRAARKGGAS